MRQRQLRPWIGSRASLSRTDYAKRFRGMWPTKTGGPRSVGCATSRSPTRMEKRSSIDPGGALLPTRPRSAVARRDRRRFRWADPNHWRKGYSVRTHVRRLSGPASCAWSDELHRRAPHVSACPRYWSWRRGNYDTDDHYESEPKFKGLDQFKYQRINEDNAND